MNLNSTMTMQCLSFKRRQLSRRSKQHRRRQSLRIDCKALVRESLGIPLIRMRIILQEQQQRIVGRSPKTPSTRLTSPLRLQRIIGRSSISSAMMAMILGKDRQSLLHLFFAVDTSRYLPIAVRRAMIPGHRLPTLIQSRAKRRPPPQLQGEERLRVTVRRMKQWRWMKMQRSKR